MATQLPHLEIERRNDSPPRPTRTYPWYDTSIDLRYLETVVEAVRQGKLAIVRADPVPGEGVE